MKVKLYTTVVFVLLAICIPVCMLPSCNNSKGLKEESETSASVTETPTEKSSLSNDPDVSETATETVIGGNVKDLVRSIEGQELTATIGTNSFSVVSAYVDESDHLYIVLTDHTVVDAGLVRDSGSNSNDSERIYTVEFHDYDGSLICSRTVSEGAMAIAPNNPVRDGYTFIGWDNSFNCIVSDLIVTAQYRAIESTAQITVKDAAIFSGIDTVEIEISIQNNPGILGMILHLDYDSSVFSLVNAENGDALHSLAFTKPGKFESPCKFTWDGIELNDSDICDGIILKLTFQIAEGASNGVYPISLSYDEDDIIGADLTPLEIGIESGSIIIIS